MKLEKPLKNDIKSIIEFIETVENEHSEKISAMIRNDVEMFFDIDRTLLKIKTAESDSVKEIFEIKDLLSELHQKLLLVEKLNLTNQKLINNIIGDHQLIRQILLENKETIKEVN